MKILKKGNWERVCTCGHCDSHLSVDIDDLRTDLRKNFWVCCSVCEERIYIDAETIPKFFQEKIALSSHLSIY